MLTVLKLFVLAIVGAMPVQERLGEYWGTGEAESKYYKLVDVPLPESLAIEAGSFEVMPDNKRLAISTRRGDLFLADGVFEKYPQPKFHKFASGLDEIFGMAFRDGAFWVTQQGEVTRIRDTNGDNRADSFETISDVWGFRNYHEFAFGSKPDPDGNIWVALCLSKSYHSDAPFRGWCLKITPEGKSIPVCSGIRSPCGIGPNEHGVMFYSESQGPWNGSCSLKVLEQDGFMGHPISFNWYELAPEMGPKPVQPNTPSRLEVERKRVKELVPYAVVFPYKRMGRSISGFMVDRTGGKFGPFENQIFVADFSLGVILRATTEKVNGVWQGACYPFREGFDTGLLAVQFTPNGNLIAGGTNRGWPVRGPKAYAIQRLDWTGLVPFEIKRVSARPNGFHIEFTKPIHPDTAKDLSSYKLKTFTHIYRQGYGSPEVDQTEPEVTDVTLATDGLSVDLQVKGMVQGHVHDFQLAGIRSLENESLLHDSAFYTLNEIPKSKETSKDSTPTAKSTRGIIDFNKPDDAEQLVGPGGSKLVPHSNVKSQWTFQDGVLTASPKWDSVVTPKAYRDFRMHIEFNVNDAGDVPRERNGNSGVYIQERYEIQILNSNGVPLEGYKKDDCGSIYGLKIPDQTANRPAGEWQSFDISFRAARFDGNQKTQSAKITVYQNGKLIHDDVEVSRKTGAGKREENSARPILLQGHHNQVKFRNFWIQEIHASESGKDHSIPQITTSLKTLPLRGESFQLDGQDAFVMMPKGIKRGQKIPWVWYAPTLKGLPAKSESWMFEQFLESGIAIAGIDVGESYGSPNGTARFDEFYQYLTTSRNFAEKPCLLARSRGGLMLYNWAVENSGSVSGIAGIYPVCNLESYPGLERACNAYDLDAQEMKMYIKSHNPIDKLASLAKNQIPIFHIHGDNDKVVPLDQNSLIVKQRMEQLDSKVQLEVVAGRGHDMWEGWFKSQTLVDFVLTCLDRPVLGPNADELWLTFPGKEGAGKKKKIVLIAADQEYRSEESMPMLASVLAERHGFDCTVLFSVNATGEVDPTIPAPLKKESTLKHHRIPGLEKLNEADCVIWLSRFMQLTESDLKHFHQYFDSGKPIIALRTANHGFWGKTGYKKNGKQVSLRELLGGAFQKHHGGWHREATSGVIVPEQESHPILRGVTDVWGPSDVYQCHNDNSPLPVDCTVLMNGQPMKNLEPDAPANENKAGASDCVDETMDWKPRQVQPNFSFHDGFREGFQERRCAPNGCQLGLLGAWNGRQDFPPKRRFSDLSLSTQSVWFQLRKAGCTTGQCKATAAQMN